MVVLISNGGIDPVLRLVRFLISLISPGSSFLNHAASVPPMTKWTLFPSLLVFFPGFVRNIVPEEHH